MTGHLGEYIKDTLCLVTPMQHRLVDNDLLLERGYTIHLLGGTGTVGTHEFIKIISSKAGLRTYQPY